MQDGKKPGCHDEKLIQIRAAEERLDLAAVREKLAQATGPQYWRSLEELAATPQFEEMLHREFPRHASEWREGEQGFSRRDFLKLSGASLAFAGLMGCTKQPLEPIVPYVRQPEELVLGKPLFFATAMTLSGYGKPLLVESHEGRPTKIEGNPDHPASRGASDLFAQASILSMYDPERSQTILYMGEVRPWGNLVGAIKKGLAAQQASTGAGLRILTGAVSSPTLAAQIAQILQLYPNAKWHQWEANHRDSAYRGTKMVFGAPVETHYQLEKADVVLTLDADFMSAAGHPDFQRLSRDFIGRRRNPKQGMSRLYALESSPTNTGGKADHRLGLRASEVQALARAIAGKLGVASASPAADAIREKWMDALVKDLQSARGRSVVIAGEQQTPEVHALAHLMNAALSNVGHTVYYSDPALAKWVDNTESLRDLVHDMNAGQVSMLLILSANPVYDAHADLGFGEALKKVGLKIHLGLYADETAAACQWHVPEAHYLEQWSDVRSFDGAISIVQPLIAPLYGGRSAHELLATFGEKTEQSGYEIVRAYWMSQHKGSNFENDWRRWLHDGSIANSALPAKSVAPRNIELPLDTKLAVQGTELIFRPDPTIHDGRFAANGWLQELQKTLSTLTWENAVMVGSRMAQREGLQYGDVVEIEYRGQKMRGPVYILPGHPDESVTVHFGYGRTRAGTVGNGKGFNVYPLRASSAPWFSGGITLRKTGERETLSTVRNHHVLDVREIGEEAAERGAIRSAPLEEFRKNPDFAREGEPGAAMTMYSPVPYEGYAWGMAIDLNSCIGCNSCVVACQAENNIPVVGREQVIKSREMHWLRVDAYYEGDLDNPRLHFQPVPCQQCENAPCEVVCPVGATTHSSEGLNDMVYNRCVGTRYCSNNCPYKVRRFNFYLFQDWEAESLKLMRNPDVSVRSRGVMEKCTYCVQRINAARIEAETQDRKVRDGEIQTACQQSCPTQAIVFGDINDKKSAVSRCKADSRNYGLLAELNTRPRTTYLAEVRNPNPELPVSGPGKPSESPNPAMREEKR
ncbi:MAG: TAT-variant-translocated molybdopterin oxidoreductase [Acidobacteriia bacterium]|nr:TAT-variant-translocated molybdopterin oxidoreductase [Terriglobia bacterium]